MREAELQPKSVQTSAHDLPRDLSAAIRFLERVYAAADVLYRALHRADELGEKQS